MAGSTTTPEGLATRRLNAERGARGDHRGQHITALRAKLIHKIKFAAGAGRRLREAKVLLSGTLPLITCSEPEDLLSRTGRRPKRSEGTCLVRRADAEAQADLLADAAC